MRVYRPRGELIEGRGTKPHVTVAWSRRDVLEGRDPDLDAALREARADPAATCTATRVWAVGRPAPPSDWMAYLPAGSPVKRNVPPSPGTDGPKA